MGKIKNPLPRPLTCDCCNSPKIALVQNSILYGKTYGDWPLIWYCYGCTAAVGCHPQTDIPLGKMADRTTRQWRKKAHEAFDPLWQGLKWLSRNQAYGWLAENLSIPVEECHISWFNIDQCKTVIQICTTKRPVRKDYDHRRRKSKL